MRLALALLSLVLLPLVGCGDDDAEVGGGGPTTSASPPTTSAGEEPAAPPSIPGPVNRHGAERLTGNQLEMELDDFYFGPTFVQASPDEAVTVRLHNEGSVQHTFTISGTGVDAVLQPGQEMDTQVTLPSDGPVVFVCRFHENQGMRGAFYFS